MQEIQYTDGTFVRKFFEARTADEMRRQMVVEHRKAMHNAGVAEIESIRQVVLDPESRCPCGSGKLTKNCCIKRLRSFVARQEHFAAT